MPDQQILISVLLPVYNGGEFVFKTIDSILAQSYTNFELLVIDDGSDDIDVDKFNQISDPRFRLIRKPHGGLGETLNLGLSEAKGDYIARIDSDDIAHPERFRLQIEFLQAHPEISVLGSAHEARYPDGRTLIRYRLKEHANIYSNAVKVCPVVHPTVMARRHDLIKMGGYDLDFDGSLNRSIGMDYHLWVRMLANGYRFANLEQALITQYKRPGSVQGRKSLWFRIKGRIKMRLWVKQQLEMGPKAYFEIIGVTFFSVLNYYGFKLDTVFNLMKRNEGT